MSNLEKKFPYVEVNLKKLEHNINKVVDVCGNQGISIAGVVKGFNGIKETLPIYQKSGFTAIASSRLEHIEDARAMGLAGPYMLIRIPMLSEIPDLVKLTDISLNSEIEVLKAINAECQNKEKPTRLF